MWNNNFRVVFHDYDFLSSKSRLSRIPHIISTLLFIRKTIDNFRSLIGLHDCYRFSWIIIWIINPSLLWTRYLVTLMLSWSFISCRVQSSVTVIPLFPPNETTLLPVLLTSSILTLSTFSVNFGWNFRISWIFSLWHGAKTTWRQLSINFYWVVDAECLSPSSLMYTWAAFMFISTH